MCAVGVSRRQHGCRGRVGCVASDGRAGGLVLGNGGEGGREGTGVGECEGKGTGSSAGEWEGEGGGRCWGVWGEREGTGLGGEERRQT